MDITFLNAEVCLDGYYKRMSVDVLGICKKSIGYSALLEISWDSTGGRSFDFLFYKAIRRLLAEKFG
jgi:hypothetical protein